VPLPALCASRVDAWLVVHQTFSVTVALGGLLRGREGGPLNWPPSAHAVAGNGAPLSWRPSADAVAGEAYVTVHA